MPSASPVLGEFEIVVILAVLQLREGAFGSAIRNEIELRSGRRASRGAVYITLDRLEEKHLLESTLADGSDSRGGRPKRFFTVTAAGVRATRHSLRTFARMAKGLAPLLGGV